MAIVPLESSLSDQGTARSILEAEVKQLQEFLTEALADSARLAKEKEELALNLAAARQSEAAAIEKLSFVEEDSEDEACEVTPTEALLRAELAQTAEVLERSRRTLHELSMVSAGVLGLSSDPRFYASDHILRLIEATMESIETTLIRTTG